MSAYQKHAATLISLSDGLKDEPGAGEARIAMYQAAGTFAIAAALQEIADVFKELVAEAKKDPGPKR